jgi:hypothetical protein
MRNRRNNLGVLGGNVLGSVTIPTPVDLVSGLVNTVKQGKYGPVANPVPQVPAACWSKPNFGACQSWAISSPQADCQNLARAGNWPDSEVKNCIEDKYRYRFTNYCINSCNAGAVTWPGGTAASAAAPAAMTTLALQQALNPLLTSGGYTQLATDGKLGKKTCGAARQFMPNATPTECATIGYTDPTKPGAYVASSSSSSSTAIFKPAATTSDLPTTSLTTAGMLSNAKWMIGASIAVALGLAGVAIAKKKGWIKTDAFEAKPVSKR